LARLVEAGHDVNLVITQPDRPAGRGLRPVPGPVKRFALARGLEVYQPDSLKSGAAMERVRAAAPEALVVAAYGLILPQLLLDVAPHGAINIHASLLPRWRGAAPIQRALLAGDGQSGISIMQMDAGLDTGAVLAQRAVPIAPEDDAGTLHDKLAALGADMIIRTLDDIAAGRAQASPQPKDGATYARKVDKREIALDWMRPATELERAVRAFHPAAAMLGGEPIRIWRSRVAQGRGAPGTVLGGGELVIACGDQALAVQELQRAGGRRLSAAEFLRGHRLRPGDRFE
jgi:methionyl-tRNA formyltransferase